MCDGTGQCASGLVCVVALNRQALRSAVPDERCHSARGMICGELTSRATALL